MVLCSWDKSLNIETCPLPDLNQFHSFSFDHLNHMQQMVWDMGCIFTHSWDRMIFFSRDTILDNPFLLIPFALLF